MASVWCYAGFHWTTSTYSTYLSRVPWLVLVLNVGNKQSVSVWLNSKQWSQTQAPCKPILTEVGCSQSSRKWGAVPMSAPMSAEEERRLKETQASCTAAAVAEENKRLKEELRKSEDNGRQMRHRLQMVEHYLTAATELICSSRNIDEFRSKAFALGTLVDLAEENASGATTMARKRRRRELTAVGMQRVTTEVVKVESE